MSKKLIWRLVIGVLVVWLVGSRITTHVQSKALLADLKSGSPEVQVKAVEKLMVRDRLFDRMQQLTPKERLKVMDAVDKAEARNAFRQIQILLKDADPDVHARAAESLAKRGRSDLKQLVASLRDTDENVRSGAKDALVEIGEPALPLIKEAAEDTELKGHAFEVLLRVAEPAVPTLVELMKTGELDIRMTAADTLAKIGDKSATPALIETAAKDVPAVRRIAISSLCTLGDPRAEDLLIQVLGNTNDDGEVRARAARALSVIGGPKSIAALTRALGDYDLKVQTSVITGLQSKAIASQSVAPVMSAISSGTPQVRRAGASVLEQIDNPQSAAGLVSLLKYPDPEVRLSAARGLGNQTASVRGDVLVSLLSDADGRVADAAADSLVRVGTSVIPTLVGVIKSGAQSQAKFRAATALGRIGSPAVPALQAQIGVGGETGRWAAYALGLTGDPGAKPTLERFASSSDPDMRWVVERALTQL